MNIPFDLAHKVMQYLKSHRGFYFPFTIVCSAHSQDGAFEIESVDELAGHSDCKYFTLQENLQNLDYDTTSLLAQGFLDHITGESLVNDLAALLSGCSVPVEIQESSKVEDYGLVEFINGKREAYEECLRLVKKHRNLSLLQVKQ
jgi:hypothetical protein